MKENKPLVSICCITYNQEKFIGDALDGFLAQKTDFPIEILVHDDASTDGTADIIRRYQKTHPELVFPVYQKENQYSKGVRITSEFLFPKCRGRYIAFCEGDDYWIDPLKLQKQVDIMEADTSIGLIHTNHSIRFEDKGRTKKDANKNISIPEYLSFKGLLTQNSVSTLTVLARKEDLFKAVESLKGEMKRWKMGDYPLWLEISKHKTIKYLSEITGVYRVLQNSLSSRSTLENRLAFRKSTHDIKRFFMDRYSVDEESRNEIESQYYSSNIEEAFVYKNRAIAKSNFVAKRSTSGVSFNDKLFLFGTRCAVCRFLVRGILKVYLGR